MRIGLKGPSRNWALLYLASFFLSFTILNRALGVLTDGDIGFHFYDSGMRAWSDILRDVFLPPADKIFVFGIWRPTAILFFPKLLWTLGLSPLGYKLVNWVIYWVSCYGFAWGMVRALSLGIALAPEATWVIALLCFWSPAGMVLYATAYMGGIAITLGYAAVGLVCSLGTGRTRWWRAGAALLLAFLGVQAHESNWLLFGWLAAWLLGLQLLGISRKGAPRFWWPLAFVGAHILLYRGLHAAQSNAVFHVENNSRLMLGNMGYYLLDVLNGFTKPVLDLFGVDHLDVTIMPLPTALALTCAAIATLLIRRPGGERAEKKRKPARAATGGAPALRERRAWYWADATLLLIGFATTAPYWAISSHRFIYWSRLATFFFAVWFGARSAPAGKPLRLLPVLLLLAGNGIASANALINENWVDWNNQYSRQFYDEIKARPEFRDCSSERPCCLDFPARGWARDEWALSWMDGAPKYPSFIPENWVGIPFVCAKHLVLK